MRPAATDRNAQPVEPVTAEVPNEAPDDPHRLARQYADARCAHADGLTLRFWRREFHRWAGAAYRVVPEEEVRAELCGAIKGEFDRINLAELRQYETRWQKKELRRGEEPPTSRRVTKSLVANVQQALTGLAVVPAHVEQPAWLGDPEPFPADEVLAARNGLVHLPSFAGGKLVLLPPTPRFFSANALDYDFAPDAPKPEAWLGFLGELWPDDPQSIAALQEWFGYCLLPDTTQQKMLLMVGPRRSGKGTIAAVLERVVGTGNVAGPTLSSLATPFGLAPLLGKTLAVIPDARLGARTDQAVITERLLAISGEDTLTVDRKFLPAVEARLAARLMILTNELPRLTDASRALAGRMLVLRLTQSWFGRENPALKTRLLQELPGILLWAVEGWKRLRERGHFVQPGSGEGLLEQLSDLTSPVGEFVGECCVVGAEHTIPKLDLYDRWCRWCTQTGREHPGDRGTFTRNLTAAVPSVRPSQPRGEGGKRVAAYAGIRLRA